MHLRARKCRPSVGFNCRSNCELVPVMTHRMHGALIASLSLVALTLGANQTLAQTRAAAHARASVPPSVVPSLRHHRGNRLGAFLPATGGFFYDPSTGQAPVDFAQPASRDMHYTYTDDVPWDWAHRYPPNVIPSQRAYVPECPQQTVTVAGRGGKEQTVNIMRCY
jgi:hypothetical protein